MEWAVTLRRWRGSPSLADRRHAAAQVRLVPHALSNEEKQAILKVCNQEKYENLPPSQIVPDLADQGQYLASESSFYRVLKEFDQNHQRGKARTHAKPAKPMPVVATAPCQVWSWDITMLASCIAGQFFRLYIILDIFSRLVVHWEVHPEENSEHAANLIEQACWRHQIKADQLILHSDNGSPMRGSTMLYKLQSLGVMPSFSRPSVSDDNPYSEAMFRTLKYCPAYPTKPFQSIDQARQWVRGFVTWYNTQHKHSGIRHVTPAQRHTGQELAVLKARELVYEHAKKENPDRWRGRPTRNWTPVGAVFLNPNNEVENNESNLKVAA